MEARDEPTLARASAADPRAFFERFLRLAAVVTWAPGARPAERTRTWRNTGARFVLPDQALAALVAALDG